MVALVATIHVFAHPRRIQTWMLGTSPSMTAKSHAAPCRDIGMA